MCRRQRCGDRWACEQISFGRKRSARWNYINGTAELGSRCVRPRQRGARLCASTRLHDFVFCVRSDTRITLCFSRSRRSRFRYYNKYYLVVCRRESDSNYAPASGCNNNNIIILYSILICVYATIATAEVSVFILFASLVISNILFLYYYIKLLLIGMYIWYYYNSVPRVFIYTTHHSTRANVCRRYTNTNSHTYL